MLQLQGEPVAFAGLLLRVGELVTGGGQRHLGPVVGGDVLVGAAYHVQLAVGVEDRLGDHADVAGDSVGPLEPEGGGRGAAVVHEGPQEPSDGDGVVGCACAGRSSSGTGALEAGLP